MNVTDILQSQMVASNYMNSKANVDDLNFSEILKSTNSRFVEENKGGMNNLLGNVIVKNGNCTVTEENWNRTDFPVWEYFKDNTDATSLNGWKAYGNEPPQTSKYVQEGLGTIGFGEMRVLIPDSLQKKMDADSEYAAQVWNNISEWKKNYDLEDNMIADSCGLNVLVYQMSKSYCIQLNENGEIEKYTVISGGLDDSKHSDKENTIHKDVEKSKKTSGKKHIEKNPFVSSKMMSMQDTYMDYSQLAAYFAPSYRKKL